MAEKSRNTVILLGRLGKDAETKFTPSGTAVTNFSIATSRRWKQNEEWKEETDWHQCVLWRAEKLAEYLKKGTRLEVEGRLKTRSYEDKDGNKKYVTEVVVEDVILLGDGSGNNGGSKGSGKREDDGPPPDPNDDDVPF